MSDYFAEQEQLHDASTRMRARLRAARLGANAPVLEPSAGEAPPGRTFVQPADDRRPIAADVIDALQVPPGTVVFASVDDALRALKASGVASGQPSLAGFARARLRALIADPQVKDQTLIQAARALLRDHPPGGGAHAQRAPLVCVLPDNGRGPAPHGQVFHVRAAAELGSAPTEPKENTL